MRRFFKKSKLWIFDRLHFKLQFRIFLFLFTLLNKAYCQRIGVNTSGSAPNSKAILDVDADNTTGEKKGMLIPRLTTTQRNTLSGSGTIPESLMIFNTTTHCFEAWNQSSLGWVAFGCLNCQLPAIVATTATGVSSRDFTAQWTASVGATGYYLDVSTSSTFSSFVTGYNNLSVGNVVAYSVMGLTASTVYYYRVRAENACGTSTNSTTVSLTTVAALTCKSTQVESDYGTVVSSLSGASQTWITRNLGSTAISTSLTDNTDAAAGCYFQFNRSQAYGCVNGGTVSPAWPGAVVNEANDWSPSNDPCSLQLGGAWRLPTQTEWANCASGWSDNSDAYSSVLKLHMAGRLLHSTGALTARGTQGRYWSSNLSPGWTPNNLSYAFYLLTGGPEFEGEFLQSVGISVRCLK